MHSLSAPVAVLGLLDFVFIGLLPVIFFRRDGRFNALWFATALPFFVAPVLIVLNIDVLELLVPVRLGLPAERLILETTGVILYAASIALIAWTLGSHGAPIALWHQDNDAPAGIVTRGPYALVRHPFYSSFLLCFLATTIACANWGTVTCFVYSAVVLSATARREERKLAASAYGAEYRVYMQRTGRLVPGFGRVA